MPNLYYTLLALALLSVEARAKPQLLLQRADFTRYPRVTLYAAYVDETGRAIKDRPASAFHLEFDESEVAASAVDPSDDPAFVLYVATRANHFPIAALEKQKVVRPSLLEAMNEGMKRMEKWGRGGRSVLVVFSDGRDAGYIERRVFSDFGKRALELDVVVDTIAWTDDAKIARSVAELAKQSNGVARVVPSDLEPRLAFDAATDEIAHQYAITFDVPVAGGGREHAFRVADVGGREPVYSNTLTSVAVDGCTIECGPARRWWPRPTPRLLFILWSPLALFLLAFALANRLARRPIK